MTMALSRLPTAVPFGRYTSIAMRRVPYPSSQSFQSRILGPSYLSLRSLASDASKGPRPSSQDAISEHAVDSASTKSSRSDLESTPSASTTPSTPTSESSQKSGPVEDWEENPNLSISKFAELPSRNFGYNQHMVINDEFKEALRMILWEFKAPIRYAFAYGSGVFPQSKPTASSSTTTSIHAKAPPAVANAQGGTPKMIDFIFGVSHPQHWHSLNLRQHRDHYSGLGSFGTGAVSRVQGWGAGVYFHPYVMVNGILIKYGVVSLDTLCTDLSEWSTLYTAGRLHKPVKILRDDARVRLANQINLISALRTALLLLPPDFTEMELYGTIANISYMGDPRMSLPTEDPGKVANIVGNNVANFRRLYGPLIQNLPNVDFNDPACQGRDWIDDPDANVHLTQDMDPFTRGNMVRRLPKAFRSKLYFQYQKKYQIPQLQFNQMMQESTSETKIQRQQGGGFEQRIARESEEDLRSEVRGVIKKTIWYPATVQSLKGPLTAGFSRTRRYMNDKQAKYRAGIDKAKAAAKAKEEEKKSE